MDLTERERKVIQLLMQARDEYRRLPRREAIALFHTSIEGAVAAVCVNQTSRSHQELFEGWIK